MVAMDTEGQRQQQRQRKDEMDVEVDTTATTTTPAEPSGTATKSPATTATEWKQKGNVFFSSKQFPEAVEAYQKGLRVLQESDLVSSSASSSSSAAALQLAAILHTNTAQVLTKMRRFQQAEQEANKALEMDPGHIKGV
ncbi:MAG: hypothetical protein SGARI_003840, partial [Bacillariaceae sp.]